MKSRVTEMLRSFGSRFTLNVVPGTLQVRPPPEGRFWPLLTGPLVVTTAEEPVSGTTWLGEAVEELEV